MRIVVEPHIDCRAASSLAAAEKFEPYLSSLADGLRRHSDPNFTEASFRLPRQTSHDEPERAAGFRGELPAPQPTFVFDVVASQHRADAGSAQRLIDRPFQAPPVGTAHQQHAPAIDHRGEARRVERVVVVDDHQRPIVGHRRPSGPQGAKRCSGSGTGGQPFDEGTATKSLERE